MDGQAGKYRDIAELGRGGMGDVYLTVALGPAGFNKLLVVKRLRQQLAGDPDFLEMFLNEARVAARLNHPNIVQTYDVGFDGARYYIAMEYLQGQSMSQLVRSASAKGGLPLSMQLRVLIDALAGLHYAHEQHDYDGAQLEIVHRDVSPPNIFVLYDGQVKVVDFGIAKSAQSGETRAGVFKGKVQYVAPEQYTAGDIDRRTDIYSAGVILWEAATRRRMWKGVMDLTIMQRVVAGDIPLPSSIEPQVPKQLETICMRALALHKEDRYPTAAAFQAELEAFMTELGERVTALDVGKYTAELFTDTRTRMKLIIDSQLKVLRESTDQLSLIPIVSAPQVTATGTASWMPPLGPPKDIERRRMGSKWIVAGMLGLIAAGAAFVTGRRAATNEASNAAPGATSTPPRDTPAGSLSSAPAVPEGTSPKAHIRLVVDTVPRVATVAIDDATLAPDRRELELPRDNSVHRIWAAAPGYRPKAEWVRFDAAELAINIVLDQRPAPRQPRDEVASRAVASREGPHIQAAPPPVWTAETAVAPPPPAPEVVPALRELDFRPLKRQAPLRSIDTDDPWKK